MLSFSDLITKCNLILIFENIINMKLVQLPKILDERGNLSFLEASKHFSLPIKRVYLVYDVPGGEVRGGHAFKSQSEMIIALSGSFDVIIKNVDSSESIVSLNRSYTGLFLPPMHWRTIQNFSTNAVCLVISSELYDESDYIRDFNTFNSLLK